MQSEKGCFSEGQWSGCTLMLQVCNTRHELIRFFPYRHVLSSDPLFGVPPSVPPAAPSYLCYHQYPKKTGCRGTNKQVQ